MLSLGPQKLCAISATLTQNTAQMISDNPRVLWLRDTESTVELRRRLQSARRVVIVGNGGIALELVHEVRGCEVSFPRTSMLSFSSFWLCACLAFAFGAVVVSGGAASTSVRASACVKARVCVWILLVALCAYACLRALVLAIYRFGACKLGVSAFFFLRRGHAFRAHTAQSNARNHSARTISTENLVSCI
eukprot:383051-Rhodomonas_salina.1